MLVQKLATLIVALSSNVSNKHSCHHDNTHETGRDGLGLVRSYNIMKQDFHAWGTHAEKKKKKSHACSIFSELVDQHAVYKVIIASVQQSRSTQTLVKLQSQSEAGKEQ